MKIMKSHHRGEIGTDAIIIVTNILNGLSQKAVTVIEYQFQRVEWYYVIQD